MSFLSNLFGGLTGAIGKLIPGPLGDITQSVGNSINNQNSLNQSKELYNMQLAGSQQLQDSQNAWSEKMWHMNNKYNSPVAQIKRLQDAGLNSNLAYGSLSGNVASPATSFSRNSPSMHDPSSMVMANAQLQKLGAETDLLSAQADAARAQANRDYSQGKLNSIDASFRASLNQSNIDLIKSNINNSKELASLNNALSSYWRDVVPRYIWNKDYREQQQTNANVTLASAQVKRLKAEVDRIEALTPAEKTMLYSQAYMLRSMGDYNYSLKELTDINVSIQRFLKNNGIANLTLDNLKKQNSLAGKYLDNFTFEHIFLPIWSNIIQSVEAVGAFKGTPSMPFTTGFSSSPRQVVSGFH